jgi:hypothetical protein
MLTLRCAPARLSLDLLLSRSWQGEAHEAVGAFDAAATLYALNVAAIEELPDVEEALAESGAVIVYHIHDKGITPSVARWRFCEQLGFHALALKRGGRAALAQAAYERALAALPGIDGALERESMRIDILQKLESGCAQKARTMPPSMPCIGGCSASRCCCWRRRRVQRARPPAMCRC